MSAPLGSLSLFFVLAFGAAPAAQDQGEPASRLRSPEDPLEAVREAFNASRGRPRFLAVLSPT